MCESRKFLYSFSKSISGNKRKTIVRKNVQGLDHHKDVLGRIKERRFGQQGGEGRKGVYSSISHSIRKLDWSGLGESVKDALNGLQSLRARRRQGN
jgi:hypothetical protein